jgi:predicted dienelactone hydrolase
VALVCTDDSRIEPLDPKTTARRIAVRVWYPAERSGGAPATYLDVAAFERAIGADGLKKQPGGAYEAVRAGSVVTHAIEHAPFAGSLQRAPVLLFSPGGGMIGDLYTAQLEELASHGYVVAALTHSYDGFLALFPDGSSIAYDSKRWPTIPSFEGVANLNQLEWHTDDMLAVLDELTRLNGAVSSGVPFAGHLDLTHVGAFGHSFGGVPPRMRARKTGASWRVSTKMARWR